MLLFLPTVYPLIKISPIPTKQSLQVGLISSFILDRKTPRVSHSLNGPERNTYMNLFWGGMFSAFRFLIRSKKKQLLCFVKSLSSPCFVGRHLSKYNFSEVKFFNHLPTTGGVFFLKLDNGSTSFPIRPVSAAIHHGYTNANPNKALSAAACGRRESQRLGGSNQAMN